MARALEFAERIKVVKEELQMRSKRDQTHDRHDEEHIDPVIRNHPRYGEAAGTLRRFRKMVGDPDPSRIFRDSTRGSWTRSHLPLPNEVRD